MTTPRRPALGHFLRQPDVIRRRAAAAWFVTVAMSEQHARRSFLNRIGDLHESLRCGRRYEIIAAELRRIASELEDAARALAEHEAA